MTSIELTCGHDFLRCDEIHKRVTCPLRSRATQLIDATRRDPHRMQRCTHQQLSSSRASLCCSTFHPAEGLPRGPLDQWKCLVHPCNGRGGAPIRGEDHGCSGRLVRSEDQSRTACSRRGRERAGRAGRRTREEGQCRAGGGRLSRARRGTQSVQVRLHIGRVKGGTGGSQPGQSCMALLLRMAEGCGAHTGRPVAGRRGRQHGQPARVSKAVTGQSQSPVRGRRRHRSGHSRKR